MVDEGRGAPSVQLAAAVGSMAVFEPEFEQIDSYLERLDLYLTVNNFPTERKVAALFSIIGKTVHEVLRSLLVLDRPQSKSFDELVGV